MELDLKSLQDANAFVGAPVKKEISWAQGDKTLAMTTYVRKLSYRSAAADLQAGADRVNVMAGRIAACICSEKGEQIFTAGDITGDADPERGPMNHNLVVALLNAVAEVNVLGK